jgi:hypothetical protein
VLVLVPDVRAQDLDGRVPGSYSSTREEDQELESVLQEYQIRFRNVIAPGFSWQVRLRALVSDIDQTETTTNDTTLLEPFLQLVYRRNAWQISGGGRMSRLSPKGRSSDLEKRERLDLFSRVAWIKPERPQVEWKVSQIDLQEDGLDTSTDTRSLLTTRYAAPQGATSLALLNRRFENHLTDFTREIIRGTWNGNFRQSFAGGRFVASGNGLVENGEIEEETPNAELVPVGRRPARGLFAQDTTPLTGMLADTPALIDGNLTTPAADLSDNFRNFGVEFSFPEEVDTVYLYIERRLLPGNEGDYTWQVFSSDDGDFWTPVSTGLVARFEELQNRFEITFGFVTTRFLKVVNTSFSLNEPPLAATEIQVLRDELRTGRVTRDDSRRSADATFTWRAHEKVDLNLSSFASRQAIDTSAGTTVDEDWNSTLTTTVRPGRWVNTLRLQAVNRSRSLSRSEQDRIASLTFAVSPLDRLDLSISGTHRRNTARGDLLVETNSVNVRVGARFLHDIDLALDLSVLRQEDGTLGRIQNRRRANLSLVTTLRPGLFLSNNWSVERFEFDDGNELGDRTDVDLRTRISYRPTRVLGATVEYVYQDIAGTSGDSQLYDLDWLPFPGGALQVGFTLLRDQRAAGGADRDESRVSARWTVNPKTILELNYSILDQSLAGVEEQKVAGAFLEYRF